MDNLLAYLHRRPCNGVEDHVEPSSKGFLWDPSKGGSETRGPRVSNFRELDE